MRKLSGRSCKSTSSPLMRPFVSTLKSTLGLNKSSSPLRRCCKNLNPFQFASKEVTSMSWEDSPHLKSKVTSLHIESCALQLVSSMNLFSSKQPKKLFKKLVRSTNIWLLTSLSNLINLFKLIPKGHTLSEECLPWSAMTKLSWVNF